MTRNAQILKRLKDVSAAQVAQEFGIARSRVLQIVTEEDARRALRKTWARDLDTRTRNVVVKRLCIQPLTSGHTAEQVAEMVAGLTVYGWITLTGRGTLAKLAAWCEAHGHPLVDYAHYVGSD